MEQEKLDLAISLQKEIRDISDHLSNVDSVSNAVGQNFFIASTRNSANSFTAREEFCPIGFKNFINLYKMIAEEKITSLKKQLDDL